MEDDELLRLYGACDLFVYPSLYEGFGLPILEAMACGRSVACSNSSAMPEVADSAALLFDPNSIPEMVRAMRDLLLDAELRTRMERLGLHRATLFSWEKTARKTLDVYYEIAGRGRVRTPSAKPCFFSRPFMSSKFVRSFGSLSALFVCWFSVGNAGLRARLLERTPALQHQLADRLEPRRRKPERVALQAAPGFTRPSEPRLQSGRRNSRILR